MCRRRSNFRKKFRRQPIVAFTLIELLVVIMIVASLSLLVLRTSHQLVEASLAAKCLGNLRQIGVALALYAGDHNGEFPPNRANVNFQNPPGTGGVYQQDYLKVYLVPYSGNPATTTFTNAGPFWCPADVKRRNLRAADSYGVNVDCGAGTAPINLKLIAQPKPSKCLYLLDMTRTSLSDTSFNANLAPFNQSAATNANGTVDYRHNDKANGLFVDGHATPFFKADLLGKNPDNLDLTNK